MNPEIEFESDFDNELNDYDKFAKYNMLTYECPICDWTGTEKSKEIIWESDMTACCPKCGNRLNVY